MTDGKRPDETWQAFLARSGPPRMAPVSPAVFLGPLLDPIEARAVCLDPVDGLALGPGRGRWRRRVLRAIPDDHPTLRRAALAVWASSRRDRRWQLTERTVATAASCSKTTAHRALVALHEARLLWRSPARYQPRSIFRSDQRPRYRPAQVWAVAPELADLPADAVFRATAFTRLVGRGVPRWQARAVTHSGPHRVIWQALRGGRLLARALAGRPDADRPRGGPFVPMPPLLPQAAEDLWAARVRAGP